MPDTLGPMEAPACRAWQESTKALQEMQSAVVVAQARIHQLLVPHPIPCALRVPPTRIQDLGVVH